MTQTKDVVLTVAFDVDQYSDQLVHTFTSPDGATPVHPTGLYQGEIYLCEGEVVHLKVLGGGKQDRFSAFQIIDCCLITVPKPGYIDPGKGFRYATPSPFLQPRGATYPLQLDFSSEIEDDPEKKYRLITQHWKPTLNVGNALGRWEISLVITVQISRGASLAPDIRVFSFDPEGQVGSGRDVGSGQAAS